MDEPRVPRSSSIRIPLEQPENSCDTTQRTTHAAQGTPPGLGDFGLPVAPLLPADAAKKDLQRLRRSYPRASGQCCSSTLSRQGHAADVPVGGLDHERTRRGLRGGGEDSRGEHQRACVCCAPESRRVQDDFFLLFLLFFEEDVSFAFNGALQAASKSTNESGESSTPCSGPLHA